MLAEKELDLKGRVGLWVQISVLLFTMGIRADYVIFLTLGFPKCGRWALVCAVDRLCAHWPGSDLGTPGAQAP